MNRKKLILGIALIVMLLAVSKASVWSWKKFITPANAAVSEKSEDDTSVFVKTQKLAQQSVASTITVFGEVNTGKVDTINVPQPGQLLQIPVIPGQLLHQGEVLAVLSTDPNVLAAYAQALSAQKFALAEVGRVEELLSLQLATQSQVDASKKVLHDAESNLVAQKTLGGDQAVRKIVAPFNGIVTAIDAVQGGRIAAGAAILQLGRIDQVRILFGVEASQIGLIHVGMGIDIAALHNADALVKAKITSVQNVIDPKTQQASIMVELPGNATLLNAGITPGKHVQAQIHLDKKMIWEVPRQAVLTDDKGDYLFQVKDGKAIRVSVSKTIENTATYGIDEKLDTALPIIVVGNYEVQDGMAVREGQQ